MITPATRTAVSFVSLATALTTTLALGACTRTASPSVWDAPAQTQDGRLAIRFNNEAQTYVDVYLVGDRREWWLGRVAAGVGTSLRIPDDAWEATSGFVRLAVLAGASRSAQAARDPRATFTIAQPAASVFSQQWSFFQTQLSSPQLLGAPAKTGRR